MSRIKVYVTGEVGEVEVRVKLEGRDVILGESGRS